MLAGYVGNWIPFMRAAHRVARIAHCRSDEACFALIRSCFQGDVASRLGDTGETIPAGQWYGAGLVEGIGLGLPDGRGGTIFDRERGPPSPRRSPFRPVELRREDVERLWPGGPASWRGKLGQEGWAEVHDVVLALEGLCPDRARKPEAVEPPGGQAVVLPPQTLDTPAEIASIEELAERIFAQHGTRKTFDELYAAERCDPKIRFKKTDLLAAFGRVYATKGHRPPASGWPLRSPYAERWRNKQS
jgi:hypothetical protein